LPRALQHFVKSLHHCLAQEWLLHQGNTRLNAVSLHQLRTAQRRGHCLQELAAGNGII
jgi:hypothetical protein